MSFLYANTRKRENLCNFCYIQYCFKEVMICCCHKVHILYFYAYRARYIGQKKVLQVLLKAVML